MTAGYIRRIADIVLGMVVSAVGIVMMLQANIGLEPWSVLQEGMSNTLGITYGTASMIVGAVVVAVSLLCGEPIGLGTVLNIILCALFIDGLLALDWIPRMETLWAGDPGHRYLALYADCPGLRPQRFPDGGAGPQDWTVGGDLPCHGGDCRDCGRLAPGRTGGHWHRHLGGGAGLPVQSEF